MLRYQPGVKYTLCVHWEIGFTYAALMRETVRAIGLTVYMRLEAVESAIFIVLCVTCVMPPKWKSWSQL